MNYEDPYRKRNSRRQRRRRGPGGCLVALLLRLLALILALVVLGVGLLYALPVSLFDEKTVFAVMDQKAGPDANIVGHDRQRAALRFQQHERKALRT